MKKILLIITCAFYCLTLSAQINLSGNYYNQIGICLRIEQNNFKLIMPNAARNGYYSEIMAEGILKQIDESFVELNSLPPDSIAMKGLKVEQLWDSTLKDSIKVSFIIPYQGKLEITISTNNYRNYSFDYSKDIRSIMIPDDINTLTFSISPGKYLNPQSPDGSYDGILFYSSTVFSIKKHVNHIEIEIPAMDDSFFEKYYVKGEYAKISKDSITWKGNTFIKQKKRKSE